MANVTGLLDAAAAGDPTAAAELLPLVYAELRKLAAALIVSEVPGQTLQATALVHESYLRLVGAGQAQNWQGRGHFFAAAAESMRRILIDNARRKQALKHGGGRQRLDLDEVAACGDESADQLVDLDRALERFRAVDPLGARLVDLRYFAGLTMEQAAGVLDLPLRTAERTWTFARAWLHRELADYAPEG